MHFGIILTLVSQNHEMFCPNKLRSVTVKTVTGCEDCLRNDIYYVGWGVKLYSIQYSDLVWQWPKWLMLLTTAGLCPINQVHNSIYRVAQH